MTQEREVRKEKTIEHLREIQNCYQGDKLQWKKKYNDIQILKGSKNKDVRQEEQTEA